MVAKTVKITKVAKCHMRTFSGEELRRSKQVAVVFSPLVGGKISAIFDRQVQAPKGVFTDTPPPPNAPCTFFCLSSAPRSSPGLSRREAGLLNGSRASSGSRSSCASNRANGKGRTTPPVRSLLPESETTSERKAAGGGGAGGEGGEGGGEFDCKVTQVVKDDGNAEIPLGLHKLSRDDLEVRTICSTYLANRSV